MKKILLTLNLLLLITICYAQQKKYKDCKVCNFNDTYKGKKNHGKKYCKSWTFLRKYKSGKVDTLYIELPIVLFINNGFEKYNSLSVRGKYIIDSLNEDGISEMQDSYLTCEPIYMKAGKKIESFYQIINSEVFIYTYLLYHGKKGYGFQLKKSIVLN